MSVVYFILTQFAITRGIINIRGIFKCHWCPRCSVCCIYLQWIFTSGVTDVNFLASRLADGYPTCTKETGCTLRQTAGRPPTLDLKQLEENSSWKHTVRPFELKDSISIWSCNPALDWLDVICVSKYGQSGIYSTLFENRLHSEFN